MALAQDSPESLLPPGFNEPETSQNPQPAPRPRATPGGLTLRPDTVGTAGAAGGPQAQPSPGAPLPDALPSPLPIDPAMATAQAAAHAAALSKAEMPDYARRSTLYGVGAAGPAQGALGPDAFRGVDGIYAEQLMRRIDAPIASRWLSIAVRRALMARLDTPARVSGADFAAERAWLLVRMGEAVAARAVAQSIDTDRYTPKLYQVMLQAALANGDPAAVCGSAERGAALGRERGWIVASAICDGLAGRAATAKLNALERKGIANGIDMLLAKKVAGLGARGRQAVTIEWDAVDQMNIWRFGLAMATATEIPENLLGMMGPQVKSWRAVSPLLDVRTRIAPAEYAAARGVLSNAALVDLYSAIDRDDDQSLAEIGVARDLRVAYTAATRPERMTALKTLWDEPKTADGKYARLILTARAAARLPTDTRDADVTRLVASMLSAGLDRSALRWRYRAEVGRDAWAMLALADPDSGRRFTYGDISNYSGGDDGLKQRMLFAGLAGLGHLSQDDVLRGADALDVAVGLDNNWARAIDRAARAKQPGLVVILAATGMQTSQWRGVPPEVLYHVVSAMRAVGLGGQARMIAAEAIARL